MREDRMVNKIANEVASIIIGGAFDEAQEKLAQLKETSGLTEEIKGLKREVSSLEIQRDKKQEEFDRRDREIEHKIGLEKNRQEFEIDQAKREATVAVQEEALAAKEEAFEERMKFQHDRFIEEVKYQRSLVENMMKRLPSAEILARIGNVSEGAAEKK